MTATNELSQQLNQLSDSLKQTNTLITRLSKLTFQPGSEPLEGAQTVRIELAQDIHDTLKQLEEELELLKQEGEDLGTNTRSRRKDSEISRDQARVGAQVARLTEDLRSSRGHFRRAQLTAKKTSEAAKQKERELLFSRLQNPQPPANELPNGTSTSTSQTDLLFAGRNRSKQSHLTKEELEVDASSNVTAALRRTHDLLSTELSRSRFAQETFDQSTAALAELGEHYTDLNSILSNSRNLLGTLLRSQKSDTWYLETAFYILIATLCWLVFRRILYGPFVKLPIFLWNLFAFLVNWIVLKPLYLFLTITGVITTEAAAKSTSLTSTTRTPLIIQPSAGKGNFPTRVGKMPEGGYPAGAGGSNAKVGKDPGLEGRMSEQIGKMVEASEKQNQKKGSSSGGDGVGGSGGSGGGEQKRADGTVLQDRVDVPPNRKKKMFEADVEDAKEAARVQEEEEGRKRDEL